MNDDRPTETRTTEGRRVPVRVASMLMGVTFIGIAVIALALDPDGFDERAILLWPLTAVLFTAGSMLALIAHVATRCR